MRRREFISLFGGAAAGWPLVARAQQIERIRRVGVLVPLAADDPEAQGRVAAIEQGLKQSGWNIGQNLEIDYRFGGGNPDRMRSSAAELVALAPDVILASTALTLSPLQRATRTIPIVFVQIYDPVAVGFVANLTRPDSNITGFTLGEFSLGGKMLELLKKLAPQIDHAAIMLNPNQPPHVSMLHAIEAVAPALGMRSTAVPAREAGDIDSRDRNSCARAQWGLGRAAESRVCRASRGGCRPCRPLRRSRGLRDAGVRRERRPHLVRYRCHRPRPPRRSA